MAVKSTVVSVTTSAANILSTGTDGDNVSGGSLLVSNPTGGQTVYVGGPDVTTANGFPVSSGGAMQIDLGAEDILYAVVAATTQSINVLAVGV